MKDCKPKNVKSIAKVLSCSPTRYMDMYKKTLDKSPINHEDGVQMVEKSCRHDEKRKHVYFAKTIDPREYIATSIAHIVSQNRRGIAVPAASIGISKDRKETPYLLTKQIEENSYEPDKNSNDIKLFPYLAAIMISNGEHDNNHNNYLFDVVDDKGEHVAARIDHGSIQFDESCLNDFKKAIDKKSMLATCPPYLLFSSGINDVKYLQKQIEMNAPYYKELECFQSIFNINQSKGGLSFSIKAGQEDKAMLFIRGIKDIGELPENVSSLILANIKKSAVKDDSVHAMLSEFSKEYESLRGISKSVYQTFQHCGAIELFNTLKKQGPYDQDAQLDDIDWSPYLSTAATHVSASTKKQGKRGVIKSR